jgi:outer membrane immunogenic protein
MKQIGLAITALVAVSGVAVAADMPVRVASPARIACAAQWWQGGYVGLNGGAVYHSAYRQDQGATVVPGGAGQGNILNTFGGAVGAQAGYNWTSCNTFWGVEVDYDWTSNSHFRNTSPVAGALSTGGIKAELHGVATARTRAGVILDKLMMYVTGGVAALDTKTAYSQTFAGIPPFIGPGTTAATVDGWRFGWVAGVGAEWAWTDRISFKSEVLYIGTPDKEYRLTPVATGSLAPAGTAVFNHHDSVVISRVGLNWKLGM